MEDDKKQTCDLEIEKSIDFEYFVTLFDPVRCEIMKCLAIHGTLNIKEISAYFTQDRSVISRHLDLMHRHKIVEKVKESRNVYYQLNDKLILEKFELTASSLKKLINQDC